MFNLIKNLTEVYGVSGSEEGIREVIEQEIRGKVDEIRVDAMGNLIAVKKGTGKKIMVAAHMDEIGLMATYIDDKGFIRVSNIGGISPHFALSHRVKFQNGTMGVVYYEEKLEDMKNLKLANMFVDIGATSREDAEKKVRIGDTACFVGEAILQGDLIISKALDDRCGCAIMIKTIQNMPKTDNEIYFVFTVQEELGLRGAKTAAFQLEADMGIAIDVTDIGDIPGCKPMELKVGKGPAIKIKDSSLICHKDVVRHMENTAKKNNIPYQFEVLERGGTDAGAIHLTAGGVPSGAISIPTRYIHSPSESCSLSDLENAVKLLTQCII